MRRIVVVAPHPDDEVIGAGGLIREATLRGDIVEVVVVTYGDGFPQDAARYYLRAQVASEEYLHLGYMRHQESLKALAHLGVPTERVHFLGFPDGGLHDLYFTQFTQHPWVSPTTGFDRVPYLTAEVPDTPYTGEALVQVLGKILERVRPDVVVFPHRLDDHPDHWATNALVQLAILAQDARGHGPKERLSYLVHWPSWPASLSERADEPMVPPDTLRNDIPWQTVALDPDTVRQKKRALLTYQSQVELIKPFLLGFVRSSEVFCPEGVVSHPVYVSSNPRPLPFRRKLRPIPWIREATWTLGEGESVGVRLIGHGFHHPNTTLVVDVKGVNRDGSISSVRWEVDLPQGTVRGAEGDRVRVAMSDTTLECVWPRAVLSQAVYFSAGVELYRQGKPHGRAAVTPFGTTAG